MSILTEFQPSVKVPVFVGLAGRLGAGKTSAAKYLADAYEFESIRYSQVLQDWLSKNDASKVELQSVGWDIMGGGRQAELNSQLLRCLTLSRDTVIDGLRHPIDFDCLSSALGSSFRLVFLQTDASIRFQRIRARFLSEAEFEAADRRPVESYIQHLIQSSFAVISNNDSIKYLYSQIDDLLADLQYGERN